MNTYTDEQLKQSLAKMLPAVVRLTSFGNLEWCNENDWSVQDTELLHLCWLVEETLNEDETFTLATTIRDIVSPEDWQVMQISKVVYRCIHATWQQRVIALAQVKGVEIV